MPSLNPVVRRFFKRLEDMADSLHAYHVPAIHLHDGLTRLGIVERRAPIGQQLRILRDPLSLEGLHDLGNEAWQLPLRLDGVLAPDDVLADERGVVAYENARAERDWLLRSRTVSA